MKNIRQSGLLPKYSSWSVFIPPCELQNLVAERCQMTNLRCRTILPAQTLVSQQVPCLGVTEYGEKGQRNFHAVTWPSISRDARQATAQGNHQCQWEDQFHDIEQEKRGLHRQKARIHIQIRSVGRTFHLVDKTQSRVLYWRERRAATWPGERLLRASFFLFLSSAAVTKTGGWTTSLGYTRLYRNIMSVVHGRLYLLPLTLLLSMLKNHLHNMLYTMLHITWK